MRPILSSIPQLSADERRRVDAGTILNPLPTLSVWAHVFRDPMQGPLRRLPWHAPALDAGAGGSAFVPVSCANTYRFGMKSSCRNTQTVTSLYHPCVWNMNKQYRSTRYILRRPVLLLQGALIKRVTVLLSGRENRLIRIDLPHPSVLRLVHATVW